MKRPMDTKLADITVGQMQHFIVGFAVGYLIVCVVLLAIVGAAFWALNKFSR